MPELHLQLKGNTLTITLGEHSTSIPFSDVAPVETTGQRIYDDPAAYGRELFEKTFRDEQLRTMLAKLPTNDRLLLLADDPLVAVIPWEYLRDQHNKLLASRLNFVRSLPPAQRRAAFTFAGPLQIIAIPASPVDNPSVLNTEREWKNLVEAVTVTNPPKVLTATRVRPPTLTQMERTLSSQGTSIVHFMGHSASRAGKGLLAFEDSRARSHLLDAADFADALDPHVFLVLLNSCSSAVAATTEFGNISQALVRRGIPYALGMQFVLLDDAALELSRALYDFLLQGRSLEEAVRRTRRALEQHTTLHNPLWLAGIPVLYTSLREPALPIVLAAGQPIIQPDPERLQKTCDLTALPQAQHFVGRGKEISAVLDVLLAPGARGFVALHGLGGIGKTSLARAVAERVSWRYADRVLAVSFETFASIDAANQRTVNQQFADLFYNRLARFYELDPSQYPTTPALQQAILQRRQMYRSLLVLDNVETLIDAQKDHATAQALATFISRLTEGDGAILLTSRIVPPPDWGDCTVVSLSGLSDEAGAELFLALLPKDREHLAPPAARLALSHRVDGHPLSIRLLAGRFAETTSDLSTFLTNIEAELELAEQATPTSLEDPERQRTLYACMDYSVKRLSPEQRKALDAVSLFQAPFLTEFAVHILDDEEQTPVYLQKLVRLGLLTATIKTFQEGELILLELHPMLRWYIQQHLAELNAALQERYGEMYEQLTRRSYQPEGGYDQSSWMRYLIQQSLPDCEAALQHLPPAARSALAYHLAKPYERLGQNRRALDLYEQALVLYQELGDVRSVAVTQGAMADVLVQVGKPQEALALYEQALRTTKELGDVRGVAVTQHALANVLVQVGKPQEALALYEQALRTDQELGEVRGVAVTQHALANVLVQVGKPQEAMALYEQALRTHQELGDVREVAVSQGAMADVLVDLGKPQEAMALYEQALRTTKELGDVRGVAVTQGALANVLVQVGKPQEAMALYEQTLRTHQELGEVRGVAVTQHAMANVLVDLGKPQEAMALYEQALRTKQELGDVREVAVTQGAMAGVLVDLGKPQEAMALYEQALRTKQELGDVRGVAATQHALANVLVQVGKPQEAMALYEQALRAKQELGDVRGVAVTQGALANVLVQVGKPQEAMALYEQALRTIKELGDVQGVAVTQSAIANVLRQLGKPQEAMALYEQSLRTTKELGDVQSVAAIQGNYCQLLLQQAEHQRALAMAWEAYTSLSQHGYSRDAGIMRQLLISIKEQDLGPEQFDALWEGVINLPQPDWLRNVSTSSSNEQDQLPPDTLKVVVSNTVSVMTKVPEKEDEWREVMVNSLKQAQILNRPQDAEFFTAILAILDGQVPSLSQGHPYTDALDAIRAGIAAGGPQADDLPFDTDLIRRSIAALLGSPQGKMAHMQYLSTQTAETTDEALKALIAVIQLALFNSDLSQLGRDLSGVYLQAWQAIIVGVESGGLDPRLFDLIATNTLAVLGPATNQRSEWRNKLVDIRNQATAQGARNLLALLDAVIGLLDAGGNPTGLGEGLTGVYAKTWQAIVEQLRS